MAEFTPPANGAVADADLWAHYDATLLGLANDAVVAAWPDASTNGRNLAQADAAKQPVFKVAGINGHPAVQFDGANDYLVSAHEAAVTAPKTMLGVFKVTAANGFTGLWRLSDAGLAGSLILYRTLTNFSANAAGAILDGTADAAAHVIAVVAASPAGLMALDGEMLGKSDLGAVKADGVILGAAAPDVGNLGGLIGELLVYSRALDERELTLIGRYLQRKWGTPAGGF